MFCHYFPSFSPIFKIDFLSRNFPHTRHGKAAGCVSNLPHHRSQRPTLSIIHKTFRRCKLILHFLCLTHFYYYT
ncbi:hypothetical protein D0469_11765 [Peribacillus saganii]|uniref:Uncharacterized protein n=1 Tax=Peribacillus saganii TaxID=2303992 RepID=A0A372LMQ2_9BACI|nr:hypothetical protein D0469_11765 [Peribacillus saganii]